MYRLDEAQNIGSDESSSKCRPGLLLSGLASSTISYNTARLHYRTGSNAILLSLVEIVLIFRLVIYTCRVAFLLPENNSDLLDSLDCIFTFGLFLYVAGKLAKGSIHFWRIFNYARSNLLSYRKHALGCFRARFHGATWFSRRSPPRLNEMRSGDEQGSRIISHSLTWDESYATTPLPVLQSMMDRGESNFMKPSFGDDNPVWSDTNTDANKNL
mmetsp:Transcript_15582/g.20300  ORF Transcript_15582/g.20300 Transcript_15582/m.20300 type:complete len:214 (+) Transcript_15582:114-755(+)